MPNMARLPSHVANLRFRFDSRILVLEKVNYGLEWNRSDECALGDSTVDVLLYTYM